jgi:hypothetical protein
MENEGKDREYLNVICDRIIKSKGYNYKISHYSHPERLFPSDKCELKNETYKITVSLTKEKQGIQALMQLSESLEDFNTPEEMIKAIQRIMSKRDALRAAGHCYGEKFETYAGVATWVQEPFLRYPKFEFGVKYLFETTIKDADGIEQILHDFDFK